MELSGFSLKIFCCAFPLIELMFQCAVESVSDLSDLQHRPKFGFYRNQGHNKNSKLYKYSRRSRSDGSQNIVLSNDHEDISKTASEILEFIETIHSNKNIRDRNCDASKEYVKLSKFNYKIPNKTLFEAYRNQCAEAVSIANALTTYYRHRQNPESDPEASIVLALLRSKVDSNPLIAAGGIAFMNDLFPYVYKNTHGITNVSDSQNKYDYKEAGFFSRYYPKACTAVYNDKYNSSLKASDGYWEDPVYECLNLERWIVSYSIPFYEEKLDTRCLK